MIRDFAKNIIEIRASSNGQPLTLSKQDKQTWLCAAASAPIEIVYTVYAWDLSVRTAHLDTTHAFFNGSSVFLAVKDQEDVPVSVNIRLPEGEQYKNWRVATSLRRMDTELFAAGNYSAQDYDELIDHPVEMGSFVDTSFEVDGTPHHIVITGRQNADLKRLTDDVEKICKTHVAMFGELATMERYVFLLTVVGNGYGGLEHRNSTALLCSRKDLPTSMTSSDNPEYANLLGLFSHEYFHTWNVKRIKPEEFIPYQLQQETYTTSLWAYEGITSYYDELGLIRSGVIGEDTYLQMLGKNITRVYRSTGRLKQTLLESSFDAWTKFYKQDENSPNAIVSYYVKGGLFALCLDQIIRDKTQNTFSLDSVMQKLWLDYGKNNIGTQKDTVQTIIKEISGLDLTDFFTTHLESTTDLPLDSLFQLYGLKLESYATDNYDNVGGKAPDNKQAKTFNLGAKFMADPCGVSVQIVYEDGAIQQAGIASGDTIIAINKLKASNDNIAALLGHYSPGDNVVFDVFRRDELMSFTVTLQQPVNNTFYLTKLDNEDLTQKRRQWLTLGV